jgi:hypothetical protein
VCEAGAAAVRKGNPFGMFSVSAKGISVRCISRPRAVQ